MRWEKEYQGLEVSRIWSLKQLGTENAGLKRLVAEQVLTDEVLPQSLEERALR